MRSISKLSSSVFILIATLYSDQTFARPNYNIDHLATRMFSVIGPKDGVIRDDLLYLLGNERDERGRFAVYDLSTPTVPVERGFAVLPFGNAQSMIIDEDIAFIMHSAGIGIFDISDPWHLRAIDSIEVYRPFSMAYRDNVLYVSLPENLLRIYSFRGNNHQVELLDETDVGDTLRCMTTYEDKLLAGGRRFKVYSLDDPGELRLIGAVDSTAYDIVVKEDHAFVAKNTEGVSIYQLSNDRDPEFRNSIRVSDALDLALWMGVLMVCQQSYFDHEGTPYADIFVYNLRNPASPNLFGARRYPGPG